METSNFIDYGLAGVMLFMVFQYVVKPVMANFQAKKNSDNGNGRMKRVEEDVHKLETCKVETTSCKIIHKNLDDTLGRLEKGQERSLEAIRAVNRELGEITSKLDDRLQF